MSLSGAVRPLTDSMPLAYAYDPDFERGEETEDGEKAYAEVFRIATETLNYAPITKEGGQPTLFWLRPLTDTETRKFEAIAPGNVALFSLVVRLCLVRVEHGGKELEDVKRAHDPVYPMFKTLVVEKYMDLLALVSFHLGRPLGEITNQLGGEIWTRSINLRSPT